MSTFQCAELFKSCYSYILFSFYIYSAAMSRVQANKDYTGPDCRYLNFKVGEEIIVYSKLSRKQTDLWVGSVSILF